MRTVILGVVALATIAIGQSASAARVISVNIKLADDVVYTAYYGDDGFPSAEEVWSYLGDAPYHIKKETVQIKPTKDDPLKAKLEGEVTILIKNVPNTATVKNLTLIRDDEEKQLWYLPPEEVKRTAKAAGFKVADEEK